MVESKDKQILYATFNQDGSCFALGTEDGFGIYNSNPFKDNFYRNLNGGIGIIEMLERSNIIALVGGGTNPKFDTNTVVIWDDHQGKVMSELHLSMPIKSVRLKKDKIFIVTETIIHVLALSTLIIIDTLNTCENSNGIIGITQDQNVSMIAYPGTELGCVKVKNYTQEETIVSISAHQTKLSCLALSHNGSLLATCSEMGTVIRLYNTSNGSLIKELRRGSERAEAYSLSFDCSSKYLACSSNRRKIDIFSLCKVNYYNGFTNGNSNDKGDTVLSQKVLSTLSVFFKMELNDNSDTDIAFSQFKIEDDKAICCFGSGLNLYVIGSKGKFYHITFDADNQGGDCFLLSQRDLLKYK